MELRACCRFAVSPASPPHGESGLETLQSDSKSKDGVGQVEICSEMAMPRAAVRGAELSRAQPSSTLRSPV